MKDRQSKKEDSVLILDTCAILSGYSSHLTQVSLVTTPDVIGELPERLVDSSTQLPLLEETSIDVISPSRAYLQKAEGIVKNAGDSQVSTTDMSLLALSLQLRDEGRRPVLVSDDYGLQNLAKMSNIRYLPYVERGIRRQYQWILVCPACFRQYPSSYPFVVCPICGTGLKRKVKRSKIARQQKQSQSC